MRKRDGHFCQFLHTDPIFLTPFSLHRAGKRWFLNADCTNHIFRRFRATALVVVVVGIVLAVKWSPFRCQLDAGLYAECLFGDAELVQHDSPLVRRAI